MNKSHDVMDKSHEFRNKSYDIVDKSHDVSDMSHDWDSEEEEEWCESLLPPVSVNDFPFLHGDRSSLAQMLTACSGGLSWRERFAAVGHNGDGGDDVDVKVRVIGAASACHCWIQLVDSCEVSRGVEEEEEEEGENRHH